MTVDLACGDPAFLDLTFVGLEAVPAPGEERHARDLVRSPGGAAITAIGAARLGLETALCSPLGRDPEGDFVRAGLAREGIRWAGRAVPRTPVTAVLPTGGERAMATFDPREEVTAGELAAVEPRAVVVGLTRAAAVPAAARAYLTVGDADARAGLPAMPADAPTPAALLVNEREARLLTGRRHAAEAATVLAERAACAVVTLGPRGALAAGAEGSAAVDGFAVPVVDTTGAGDLFAAAYVWADLSGFPLEDRLRWAALYAALSVRTPTGAAGAVTLQQLDREGANRGLQLPARAAQMSHRGGTP